MQVNLRLSGALADRLPGGRGVVQLSEGDTLGDLLTRFDVPSGPCVCTVNGAVRDQATTLREGDHVVLYPPLAGG